MTKGSLFTAAGLLLLVMTANAAPSLHLTILEGDRPVACRIHLKDAANKPVKPEGFPFWRDHFVCNGQAGLQLSPGDYTYEIERGPEYFATTGKVSIVEGTAQNLTNRIRRMVDLAKEGWWSGETHVHRPLPEIELHLRAEDLHVAQVMTWWNNVNSWSNALPPATVHRIDGNRFYDLMAGEDERGGGALLYFGFKQPLPITGSKREYPSASKFLREAKQLKISGRIWVDIEKPFWWDTPIWLASGLVDSVGIAHNHMHRSGVLPNEAWGRARDLQRHPNPQGNGFYTQELYYHILNAGLRIPPSAGSASGVLPNPVGYNRAYVYLEPRSSKNRNATPPQSVDEFAFEDWWNGLRAGRVFVSNGPLLRLRANEQLPGHLFKSSGPQKIRLEGKLDSRDRIAAVELIRNGRAQKITLPHEFTASESGWFLVRAIADVPNTFRFASTGPFYVEIGNRSLPVQRESAQFFLDWVRERAKNIEAAVPDPVQRAEALDPVKAAEKFWQEKVDQAKPLSRSDAIQKQTVV